MKIDPTDLYHQEAFAILKELKHKHDVDRTRKISYSIRLTPLSQPGETSPTTKQLIFRNFEKDKILTIIETYPSYVGEVERPDTTVFHTMELELQESAFITYLDKYKTAFSLPRKNKLIIQKNGVAILLVNGEIFEAKFMTRGDSFKILKLLAANKDSVVSYAEIGKVLKEKPDKDTADERRARDAVQYLKVNKFGYKGDDFIQTDYGFRLVCDVEIKS